MGCKLKTDTDFLGRDRLQEIRAAGARKKKVCFTVDEPVSLVGLEGIVRNGEYVGHVRRADHAFSINQEVAYGYVSNKGEKITNNWLKDGEYQIESRGVRYPAQIHLKSPFDAANNRIQGIYEAEEDVLDNLERIRATGNYR